eukprot:s4214_g3.t1
MGKELKKPEKACNAQVRKPALRKPETSAKAKPDPAKKLLKASQSNQKKETKKDPKSKAIVADMLKRAKESNSKSSTSSKEARDKAIAKLAKEQKKDAKTKANAKKSQVAGQSKKDSKVTSKTEERPENKAEKKKDAKKSERKDIDTKTKESQKEDAKKRVAEVKKALERESIPPTTPPGKRPRMKSPASVASSLKTRAEKAMQGMREKLEEAAADAQRKAELDGAGADMLDLLDDMTATKVEKPEKALPSQPDLDKLEEMTEQEEEEMMNLLASSDDDTDSSSQEDEEEEEGGGEEESKEEDEHEEERQEEKEEQEDDQNDSKDNEDSSSAEEESAEAKEPGTTTADGQTKATPVEDKKDEEGAGVRNSTTCKKEWDKFDRQLKSGALPSSLAPFLRKKKTDIFALWLDHDEDWDQVAVAAERMHESKNLARKQWTAIKYKDLAKQHDEAKLEEIVKKRKEQGLFYADEDFPDDEEDIGWECRETWFYMPQGRMVRQDDITAEQLRLKAKKAATPELVNALTSDEGPLPNGALPAVKAATEQGTKNLFSALDDDNKNLVKPKKIKRAKEEAVEVKPKTWKEEAASMIPQILDEATKARAKSIQLKGMDFAAELSTQLLKHGSEMEAFYSTLKGALEKPSPEKKEVKKLVKKIKVKRAWFEKAEAVNIYSEKYGDASNDKSAPEEEDEEISDPGEWSVDGAEIDGESMTTGDFETTAMEGATQASPDHIDSDEESEETKDHELVTPSPRAKDVVDIEKPSTEKCKIVQPYAKLQLAAWKRAEAAKKNDFQLHS